MMQISTSGNERELPPTIPAMLQQADHTGQLGEWLQPSLPPAMAGVAQVEGWILGVPPPD